MSFRGSKATVGIKAQAAYKHSTTRTRANITFGESQKYHCDKVAISLANGKYHYKKRTPLIMSNDRLFRTVV